jgi:hypothetical protein
MQLELKRRRPAPAADDALPAADAAQARSNLDAILAEADRILDGLRPINAEEYLQQNRQRGGQ